MEPLKLDFEHDRLLGGGLRFDSAGDGFIHELPKLLGKDRVDLLPTLPPARATERIDESHSLTLPLRVREELLLVREEDALDLFKLPNEVGAVASSIDPFKGVVVRGSPLEQIR